MFSVKCIGCRTTGPQHWDDWVWPMSLPQKGNERTLGFMQHGQITTLLLLLLHLFNGLFARTTWISRYQKGKTSLDLNEAKDDKVLGWQWHQLDHMQTVCTLLQTDNHTNTSSLNFYRPVLFLTPNQQCQSTEGKISNIFICSVRF